jgi:hypothetical protein
VNGSVTRHAARNRRVNLLGIRDVTAPGSRFAPSVANFTRELLPSAIIDVQDRNPRAFARKQSRGCRADAGRSACENRKFAG